MPPPLTAAPPLSVDGKFPGDGDTPHATTCPNHFSSPSKCPDPFSKSGAPSNGFVAADTSTPPRSAISAVVARRSVTTASNLSEQLRLLHPLPVTARRSSRAAGRAVRSVRSSPSSPRRSSPPPPKLRIAASLSINSCPSSPTAVCVLNSCADMPSSGSRPCSSPSPLKFAAPNSESGRKSGPVSGLHPIHPPSPPLSCAGARLLITSGPSSSPLLPVKPNNPHQTSPSSPKILTQPNTMITQPISTPIPQPQPASICNTPIPTITLPNQQPVNRLTTHPSPTNLTNSISTSSTPTPKYPTSAPPHILHPNPTENASSELASPHVNALPSPKNPTFASLLQKPKNAPLYFSDASLPQFKLGTISSHEGKPMISFSKSDTSSLVGKLELALVGKFSQVIPSSAQIAKALGNIKLQGNFTWRFLNSRHILITFSEKHDYVNLTSIMASKPIWYINGHPMRLFKWTPTFDVSHETPVVPVWCRMPGLPVHLFDMHALHSVASLVGTPVQVDHATITRTRLSYARVCIEVDLTAAIPREIFLNIDGVLLS